jgi:hypothetical protein
MPSGVQKAFQDCVAKVGRTYHEAVTYQPASHYWTLQWFECAVYVAASFIMASFCFCRVRRRLS